MRYRHLLGITAFATMLAWCPVVHAQTVQQACLKASNTGAFDRFGWSVAVSGDTLVAGAPFEASVASGVNGDQSNNTSATSGAAYVFDRLGTTWSQRTYLKASSTEAGDEFGYAVGLSGETAVVSASREDSGSSGVNGDETGNGATFAGAAYAFALGPAEPSTNQGHSLAGLSGIPGLVGSGPLSAGSSNSVDLANARPSAPAGLFVALAGAPVPFKGGVLLPVPALAVFVTATSAAGKFALPFTMPAGAPAGTELWFQWAIADAAGVQGFALSSAIKGLTP